MRLAAGCMRLSRSLSTGGLERNRAKIGGDKTQSGLSPVAAWFECVGNFAVDRFGVPAFILNLGAAPAVAHARLVRRLEVGAGFSGG